MGLVGGAAAWQMVASAMPTVFELALNQKIARSLDLSIPLAVLFSASEVIE